MRRSLAMIAAVTVALGLVGFAASASASTSTAPKMATAIPKPGVWLSFFPTNRVTAGAAQQFSYNSKNLPTGSKLYLQRQVGLAHVWKDIQVLKGYSGWAKTLKVPQGRYSYRIAAYLKTRKLKVSSVHYLYSYGPVSLAVLCSAPNVNINNLFYGSCNPGTVQVGTNVFSYELGWSADTFPSYLTAITFPKHTCRSLTLNFGLDSNNSQPGEVAYIQILQTRTDPEIASTPVGVIGNLFAPLDGGPFYIQWSSTDGDSVYVNGSASCWSANGE